MNELRTQKNIEQALKDFQRGALAINAKNLLDTLGYESEITLDLETNLAEEFISYFDEFGKLNTERAIVDEWVSIDFLCQLTEEEISGTGQTRIAFKNKQLDNTVIESYVFFALKLLESSYTRTQLANITREINRLTPMPAMLLFQHGQTLTLAVIDRRLHKRDESKDVLEKVTLIKDIDAHDPHPAHIKILFDLSRNELFRVHGFSNFVELHRAWAKTLDIQELNKRFYRELSNWYFWAVDNVTFPEDAGEDVEVRNATSVIRLITRLIFVWFIKEKKLVPDIFFNPREIEKILVSTDPQESTYYKAILQNLFFATLNQEMNTPEKHPPDKRDRGVLRKFRGKGRQHYNITSLYRYEEHFANSDEALQYFETIPFLNGGLFECLDKENKDDPKKILRIDGFSDRADNQLSVPNFLFFSDERDVDLNNIYDTKGKRYKVRGLIEILRRYKFTITENTPIEEEVALDPELLGKVFENLLAAYNPETGATARKQTGSFYTPREIVNYMVDESLIAYLKTALITYHESESTFAITSPPSQLDIKGQSDPVQTQLASQATTLTDEQQSDIEKKLRPLLAYNDKPHQFTDAETDQLINAIDTLKILDPACGSGAFPMGILHKLVFILAKLDPRNNQWKQRQIAKVQNLINMAEEIDDSTVRRNTLRDLEREIDNINEAFERNELDYGRKLYLIENCIYGVDIQPIAVQIAKLRFFISLVVDQRIDDAQENRGVRPLPNLETKFVAADTLIGVDKPAQQTLRNPQIDIKEKELSEIRRKHFTARTLRTKDKYRNLDKQIRDEISGLLKRDGFPIKTTEKIASWDPYDQNATADWFDSEWMFGLTVGFDVVIGNPPYVQLQKDGGRLGSLYQSCNFDTFIRTGDIYCLFYEKAHQLSKNSGHVCFITSNKWMRAGYGKKLRDYFIKHTQPVQLLDMGPDVFEAAVDTNILLFQNAVSDVPDTFSGVSIRTDFDKQTDDISQYLTDNGATMDMPTKGEPWAILSSAELNLKRKIEDVGIPLKDWDLNINYGIKTGRNEVFIIDEAKREQLIAQDLNSAEIIKPVLRGKDIKRYHAEWNGLYIISTFPAVNLNIDNYPAVKNYLLEFGRDRLEQTGKTLADGTKSRKKTGNKWFETQDQIAYYAEFEKAKIVYPDIYRQQSFTIDTSAFYCSNTCYFIPTEETWLCGLLNSKSVEWYYSRLANTLGSGGSRGFSIYIKQIPIPNIEPVQKTRISQIVYQIISTKQTAPDADTTTLENEIDNLVYELYNLTEDEIAIVEGSV